MVMWMYTVRDANLQRERKYKGLIILILSFKVIMVARGFYKKYKGLLIVSLV